MTVKVLCPECEHRLRLGGHPHKGQRVVCPKCETNLTVVSLRPVDLEVTTSETQATGPKKKVNAIEVSCPECDYFFKLNAYARQGQRVMCSDCNTILEIVGTNPLELDVAVPVNIKRGRREKLERWKHFGENSNHQWGKRNEPSSVVADSYNK